MKVDSLIELKEHKDLSLAEEADRNWTEIRDQTYLFDRKKREVTAPVSALFEFEVFLRSIPQSVVYFMAISSRDCQKEEGFIRGHFKR